MPKIHIVTDSGARFSNTHLIQQYPLTIVPYKLKIGSQIYSEDVDVSPEEVLRLVKSQSKPPEIIAPSEDEFAEIFANLSRYCDGIISIHTSREMTLSWYNAQRAAIQVSDSCQIAVIDSRTICGGQGMLARVAAESVLAQMPFDDVVQRVRGAVERIYSTYFVDSLEFLHHANVMPSSHAILGAMLNIKPLVNIEEGQLMVTEKVRNRSQAIDRLVEFISEFDDLEDAMIVQNRQHITESARLLQDRLSVEFPGRHFPYSMYGMVLAAMLGPDVTGVVILENELEGLDYE